MIPINDHLSVPIAAVLDALEEQVAVIGKRGLIHHVNRSWVRFGQSNGMPSNTKWVGMNYMSVFGDASVLHDRDAKRAEVGIQNVLEGKDPVFSFEYPCHSADQKRWFVMRIAALAPPYQDLFVISHHNITLLKLAEEQLEFVSQHDPLTGLSNRRHLEVVLQNEWDRGMRQRTPLGLIMADIDHFKAYNDRHGHLAGDSCLQRVAAVLQSFARRPGDLAARFGGEEFMLVLADTNLDQTTEIAEAIRKKVKALGISCAEKNVLTISLGAASAIPSSGQPQDLVKQADDALYRAKVAGRNRVERGWS